MNKRDSKPNRINRFVIPGILVLGMQAPSARAQGLEETFHSAGFARAPEGALRIPNAPAPLFGDPVFGGAADPSVVSHAQQNTWSSKAGATG